MKAMKIFGTVLLAGLAIGPASAADLWLHLKVDGGRHGEQVEMNMPLSMLDSFAPMLQGKVGEDGRVRIHERDYDVDELRRAWRQLENGPDATYLTVNDPDSKVRIAKRGDYFVLTALDRVEGENVEAKIPVAVLGALLSGQRDELDVAAALRALARYGEGELMTVTSDEETVRIWIDDGR